MGSFLHLAPKTKILNVEMQKEPIPEVNLSAPAAAQVNLSCQVSPELRIQVVIGIVSAFAIYLYLLVERTVHQQSVYEKMTSSSSNKQKESS